MTELEKLKANGVTFEMVVQDYNSGLSMRQIANNYETNHKVISKILDGNSIEKRRPTVIHKALKYKTKLELDYNNMAAHIRFDVEYTWYLQFEDIEKVKCLNDMLTYRKDRDCYVGSTENYKQFILYFYYDSQFNLIYSNWLSSNKERYKKPTIDHIIPKSKGGESVLTNYQILTWFENRVKNNLSQEEWELIKSNIKEYLV